ncbi:MAG: HigA family addiction module antidote protein [Candidatus Lindowbacteria bacterium]|nr:HigA family addiction module antidote protein [Candidatus Lindowbacteria bacterium]
MKARKEEMLLSDLAIPPGEILEETLDARGMTQAELARRMGRPVQVINEIVKGVKSITPDTAIQLEHVLGAPAHVWLGLENEYQLTKARLQETKQLREQISMLKDIPYAEMARRGWVRRVKDKTEQVRELILFFSVSSLIELVERISRSGVREQPPASEIPMLSTEVEFVAVRGDRGSVLVRELESAYGTRPAIESSQMALAAWLRKGEIEAQKIRTAPYGEKRLKGSLNSFRELTREVPNEFQRKLGDLCASCGIALVFVAPLPKMCAHGATRWLSSDKALVQLSVRYKYDDIFWFSFFHEVGHVLLHGKKDVFIEISDKDSQRSEKELEADKFAANTLIPPREVRRLVSDPPFSKDKVIKFSDTIGVAPSIVVGRLHHEGLLKHSHFNALRTKLEIKSDD